MTTVADICDHLRSVADADEPSMETALMVTDKQAAKLFNGMTANDVFAYRDARKAVASHLNRLRAARNRGK